MTEQDPSGKRVEASTGFNGRPGWSLLRTQWLDVPIGEAVGSGNPTWGAFSESFDACLRGVSCHVARCVGDRARLESIVTEVFVDNLDVLVSPLEKRDKLRRLLALADLLLERGSLPDPDEAEDSARGG